MLSPDSSSPSNPTLDAFLTTLETQVTRNAQDMLDRTALRSTLAQRRQEQQRPRGMRKWGMVRAARVLLRMAESLPPDAHRLRYRCARLSLQVTPLPDFAKRALLEWFDQAWAQAMRGETPAPLGQYRPRHRR